MSTWRYLSARGQCTQTRVFSPFQRPPQKPKVTKLYFELQGFKGQKVNLNGSAHMIKMTAIHICDKNILIVSSPEPIEWWHSNVVCSIGYSSTLYWLALGMFYDKTNQLSDTFIWENART